MLEVYVNDYIALAILTSRRQLDHVANGVMKGIHNLFPEDNMDDSDPILLEKLKKGEGTWTMFKDILVFMFDGREKTI